MPKDKKVIAKLEKLANGHYKNLALFGYPIKDGIVDVLSKAKIIINDISYQYSFAPIFKEFSDNDFPLE